MAALTCEPRLESCLISQDLTYDTREQYDEPKRDASSWCIWIRNSAADKLWHVAALEVLGANVGLPSQGCMALHRVRLLGGQLFLDRELPHLPVLPDSDTSPPWPITAFHSERWRTSPFASIGLHSSTVRTAHVPPCFDFSRGSPCSFALSRVLSTGVLAALYLKACRARRRGEARRGIQLLHTKNRAVCHQNNLKLKAHLSI